MSIAPVQPFIADKTTWLDRVTRTLNGVLEGRHNAYGSFTLATSTVTTEVIDLRAGISSVPVWTPTSARGAAAMTALYLSQRKQGSFVLTHDSQTYTDRTFIYQIGGA